MSSDVIRQPLLSIEEAAAYLNVPVRWVADAVRDRKVRCTKLGKHVRFRPEHLDELIDAGEQPVTAPAMRPIVIARSSGTDARGRL